MVYLKPKQLIIKDCARRFVLKQYRHEASRGLFATAELLVFFTITTDVITNAGPELHQCKDVTCAACVDDCVLFRFDVVYWTRTIRYDTMVCSKKLTGSQLSLPHAINKKLKCETKNKMMSVIGPCIGVSVWFTENRGRSFCPITAYLMYVVTEHWAHKMTLYIIKPPLATARAA